MTLSCCDSYTNFYGKLDLFLVLIFVKSLSDVHQIALKRERKNEMQDTCSSSLFKTCRGVQLDKTPIQQ